MAADAATHGLVGSRQVLMLHGDGGGGGGAGRLLDEMVVVPTRGVQDLCSRRRRGVGVREVVPLQVVIQDFDVLEWTNDLSLAPVDSISEVLAGDFELAGEGEGGGRRRRQWQWRWGRSCP